MKNGEVKRVFSGVKWEEEVAYCRAIKTGSFVSVSGTTSINKKNEIVGHNIYEQANFIFKKINNVLKNFDMDINNVFRTRMFVTDINNFDDLAKAHKEVFSENPPVATCVEVSRFVDQKLLVEIEVDAYEG